MEALADFGTVAVFNFDTFTTAIYKAWFGLFNINAAAQLASLLLILVVVALTLEKYSRGHAKYHADSAKGQGQRIHFKPWQAWLITLYASIILAIAFVAPFIQLLLWGWESLADLDQRYWDLLWHTLALGGIAAALTVVGAFILAYSRRYYRDRLTRVAVQLGTLGYALPGSVLAVGIMISLVWLDNQIADGLSYLFNYEAELLLSGTIITVLIAYVTRFLAVAFAPIDSSFARIKPTMKEAAQTLGATGRQIITRIYIPILTPGILTALLLVLVDVMKEMPATMLLRPFGWDTFAVRIYELTSEGEWERAALPAITLILVGLIPVVMLVRKSARQ
jgi:iron(III) transport system permease protein